MNYKKSMYFSNFIISILITYILFNNDFWSCNNKIQYLFIVVCSVYAYTYLFNCIGRFIANKFK